MLARYTQCQAVLSARRLHSALTRAEPHTLNSLCVGTGARFPPHASLEPAPGNQRVAIWYNL